MFKINKPPTNRLCLKSTIIYGRNNHHLADIKVVFSSPNRLMAMIGLYAIYEMEFLLDKKDSNFGAGNC